MKIHTVKVGAIGTNCYIVADEQAGTCAVIDPGDQPQKILAELERLDYKTRYIFLTHGHFDHILGVPELRGKTRAKLVIHPDDQPCLTNRSRSYASKTVCIDPPDVVAGDGLKLVMDSLTFQWLNTPGHTLGSCVILCGDAMFSGDTLFLEECGRCDLAGGDYAQMLKSLKRLAELSQNYTVYPGHGGSTTLEHERVHNPYIKEALNK